MFSESKLNYIGFVEPEGVFTRQADVIICDGLIGNYMVKTSDAIFKYFRSLTEKELEPDHAVTRQVIKLTSTATDYGATPLLGLNKLGMVGHGASHAEAYCNALNVTRHMLTVDLVGLQRKTLESFDLGGSR